MSVAFVARVSDASLQDPQPTCWCSANTAQSAPLHHEKDERAYRNISHRERRLCCGRAVLSVCQYKSGRTSRCTGWCAGTPSPTSVEQPRLRRDKLSGVAASERRAQRLSFCRADSCRRHVQTTPCRRRADDRRVKADQDSGRPRRWLFAPKLLILVTKLGHVDDVRLCGMVMSHQPAEMCL